MFNISRALEAQCFRMLPNMFESDSICLQVLSHWTRCEKKVHGCVHTSSSPPCAGPTGLWFDMLCSCMLCFMISPCILCTGPGSDILILKFVYLKADVQDFSIPGSDVDFEALELHFRQLDSSPAFAQQCRVSISEAHSRHVHLPGANMWMGYFRNY